VPWTVDDAEELRSGIDEVEDLRDEQEEEGLGEVPEDADHGKYHSSKVAVRVSYEDLGGIPVVKPESQRDTDEGQKHIKREEMRVRCRVRVWYEEV
jgi:hypothetical protein